MIKITDAQWSVYLAKYDKLIWTIARKISGDDAVANVDDNYADLCIAAINSIVAYNKKTGFQVDDFLTTKLFDQYTKTVLWNFKAKKGIPLSAKMDFRNRHFSISEVGNRAVDTESDFDIEDTKAADVTQFMVPDMFEYQDDDVKLVMKTIIDDPSVVDAEGKLKVFALLKPTGLTIHAVKKAVGKIENFLERQYGIKHLEAN